MTKNNENTSHNKEKNKNNQTYHMLSFQVLNSNLVKTENIEIHQKNIVTFNLRMSMVKTSMFTVNIFSKHVSLLFLRCIPPPAQMSDVDKCRGKEENFVTCLVTRICRAIELSAVLSVRSLDNVQLVSPSDTNAWHNFDTLILSR